jgi:hypothetical protein
VESRFEALGSEIALRNSGIVEKAELIIKSRAGFSEYEYVLILAGFLHNN